MSPVNMAAKQARESTSQTGPETDVKTSAQHHIMANAIRALAMDAVELANSGHPGLPMGAADIATVLFTKFLKFDPASPHWPDRDRFVLSAGHGSMLLYAVLHLLGYEDFPIEQLKSFRQLGANTAGHPEYGHGAGIETTTGPLGQGLANAVGMALAERLANARFGDQIVDHHTYVLAGDGDLMEGISHEAISLAGHLRLSKLIVLFDDNGISIDGPLSLSETGDQIKRFEAAGWDAVRVDGHDPAAIAAAIEAARQTATPSLIACKTIIGFGAPNKQGTSGVHGSPLGAEEIAAARKQLGWNSEPFDIPSDVRDAWRLSGLCHGKERKAWEQRLEALDADTHAAFERTGRGDLPNHLGDAFAALRETLAKEPPLVATRKASQIVLEAITPLVPEMIGGSADLTGSNNTRTEATKPVSAEDFSGRYIHYGVREHAMAAAMNGIALHGGFIPYGGTFLVFSDYSRPAIRLAALMKLRVIHVLTHDSIGLGEDGPTHQPVEHLAALRAIPNLNVFRPADAMETAECWQLALEARDTPSIIALTRQSVPALRTEFDKDNRSAHGAYELVAASKDAKVSIFATGSEVHLAVAAAQALEQKGVPARVVSVPSFELFRQQDDEFRGHTIGTASVRIAVEAAVRMGWDELIGSNGRFIGMETFGASAPAETLYDHFGITVERIVTEAMTQLET